MAIRHHVWCAASAWQATGPPWVDGDITRAVALQARRVRSPAVKLQRRMAVVPTADRARADERHRSEAPAPLDQKQQRPADKNPWEEHVPPPNPGNRTEH